MATGFIYRDKGKGFTTSASLQQFGKGSAATSGGGNLFVYANTTGTNPGATAADNVLAVYSIPANSFDVANRGINFTAIGVFANNTNAKRVKIIFNPATAVVGSTVGTGGTTIADTGSYSTTGAATWELQASVYKTGSNGSNTQIGIHYSAQIVATTQTLVAPSAITATENAAILVAVTGNATTTATDITLNFFEVSCLN